MSKKVQKYDYLPKHQKKIVLCLAKHGAMTMSETNRELKGSELTSTTRAFHDLEEKGMVAKTAIERYRGREFDTYWLSIKGLAFAMLNCAKPETVRKNALSPETVSPETVRKNASDTAKNDEEKKAIEIYFRLHSVSPKVANALDEFVLLSGKIDPKEMFMRLTPVMISLDKTEMQKFIDMTAEFSPYWKETMEALTKIADTIKKMIPKKAEKPKGE